MDDEHGFENESHQVLADCTMNFDGKYVLRPKLFDDLEGLARHLNDAEPKLEICSTDGQRLSLLKVLFISGDREEISRFLESLGLAQDIVSWYCRLNEDPWEDYVLASSSEECSFFSAKWSATGSKGGCIAMYEPSEEDAACMALEHDRKNHLAGVLSEGR